MIFRDEGIKPAVPNPGRLKIVLLEQLSFTPDVHALSATTNVHAALK
jgi:hypothetical protein